MTMGGWCQIILLALVFTRGMRQGNIAPLDSSELDHHDRSGSEDSVTNKSEDSVTNESEKSVTNEPDHDGKTVSEDSVTNETEHTVTKREVVPYIIGGTITPVKTAVAIMMKKNNNKDYVCAGTILSGTFVSTAAHCFLHVSDTDGLVIIAGESDLLLYMKGQSTTATEHKVKRVIKHPNYYTEPGDQYIWDYALLELTTEITIDGNAHTEVALLPPPGMRYVGREVRVGGWGKTGPFAGGSTVHRAIDIPIKWGRECGEIFKGEGQFFPDLMFCGGEKGGTTCNGDSGAGAIYNGWSRPIIIGVLSFGIQGCSTSSVYQKIEKALPWIAKETKLRPTYDVFAEAEYFDDYLQDMSAPSPTCQPSYILSSTGVAAEYQGHALGVYEEIESDYATSRVFKQRGGTKFIYKKDDKWYSGTTVGASSGRSFYTTDLFSKPDKWYYIGDGGAWQNDDPTLQFLPLTPTSCILQPSILITSTGHANSTQPDYLGSFSIVQGVFSAGRPVWMNSKGKVLMIMPGYMNFGVHNGIESTSAGVQSGSGPTCPTDAKAGHSDRKGYNANAWRFSDGGWVEDDTIVVK